MMNARSPHDDSDSAAVPFRRGAHWAALAAAVFTLPLLYVGGSVTTYRVGMAVPDWPTTFETNMFTFNMWDHPFGVRVEHSHRLYGAAVGLFTLVLAAWLLIFEPRKWLKWVGVLALALVIVQGVLGGFRVTQNSTFLAAVHACVGQAFFALMVALCVFTGRRWQAPVEPQSSRHAPCAVTPIKAQNDVRRGTWHAPVESRVADEPESSRHTPCAVTPIKAQNDVRRLTFLAFTVLALVPTQIALGSWLRHYGTWPALAGHAALAAAVWGCCLFLAFTVEQQKPSWPSLVPSARALGLLATLQVALGIGAFTSLLPFDGTPRTVSFYQALTRTAHQTSGALLLAAAVVFNLRCFRHVGGGPFSARSAEDAMSFVPAVSASCERGAVA
jgi:heme a synthase